MVDDLATELDVGYLLDQLNSLKGSIETLAIMPESTEDETELEWLLDMITHPRKSLKHFTALKHLVVPQVFLFSTESAIYVPPSKSCRPKDLPPKLETLEILYPYEDVEDWVLGFIPPNSRSNGTKVLPNFRQLTLSCLEEVGTPMSYFATFRNQVWWTLSTDYGIETYAKCAIMEAGLSLAKLWLRDQDKSGSEDEWSDEYEDDSDGDDDDEMPDLIDPTDDMQDGSDSDMPDLVDTTDNTTDLIDPMD
jgi:hypothetical protein